jgi:hypothetical protein
MPLIAFLLLAIVCLALLGFACACLTGQPMQALERATSLGQAIPPLVAMWTATLAVLIGASSVVVRERSGSRASPALLQRFLF